SNDEERVIVAVNKGAEATVALNEELTLQHVLTGETITANELTIEGDSFATYVVVDDVNVEHVTLQGIAAQNIELTYDEVAGVWRSEGIHLKNKQTVTFNYVINGAHSTGELIFTPNRGGKFEFVFDPEQPEQVTVLHPSDKKGNK
ncbi:hypothetical protein AB685_21465, partial [Bacillus sp. LL01]